jgi:hypothetical protein
MTGVAMSLCTIRAIGSARAHARKLLGLGDGVPVVPARAAVLLGVVRAEMPSSPARSNTQRGNSSSSSHCSMFGRISFSMKSRTLLRNISCASVKCVVVIASPSRTEWRFILATTAHFRKRA